MFITGKKLEATLFSNNKKKDSTFWYLNSLSYYATIKNMITVYKQEKECSVKGIETKYKCAVITDMQITQADKD